MKVFLVPTARSSTPAFFRLGRSFLCFFCLSLRWFPSSSSKEATHHFTMLSSLNFTALRANYSKVERIRQLGRRMGSPHCISRLKRSVPTWCSCFFLQELTSCSAARLPRNLRRPILIGFDPPVASIIQRRWLRCLDTEILSICWLHTATIHSPRS